MKGPRLFLLLYLSLITSSVAAQSPNLSFAPAVAYNTSAVRPLSVAVADVNGDGRPDLLVANLCADINCTTNGIVSVLLANGDGTFQTAVTYNSGGLLAFSVAVGDVNLDGRPDLLVANLCGVNSSCSQGSVGILLGNGDGTFQKAVNYFSGGGAPMSVAAADVNGDGRPDVVVENQSTVSNFQNRRFKRAIAIVAVVRASAIFMGQGKTLRSLEAREVRVVDKAGRLRAALSSEPDPHLNLWDDRGRVQADITYEGAEGGCHPCLTSG